MSAQEILDEIDALPWQDRLRLFRFITERTRRRPVVWARYIVAWQMTEDGFTTTQIGRRLGIDHSTVSHCRDAVKEMLEYPRYYPQELAVFRQFKKTIQDEIHTRTNAGA